MQMKKLLTPQCTLAGVSGVSKKRLLETIADFASTLFPETDSEDIFDALIERERLGSTGVGEGVAIPHCRLKKCDDAIGILMQLTDPIDFDSIDGAPVDLVFTLLVPEAAVNSHLESLQVIATNFYQQEYRDALRSSTNDMELYAAATEDRDE